MPVVQSPSSRHLKPAPAAGSKALTELRAADAYCRYLANRHYENFSVASIGLPPVIRLHLARIYAFCRTTDDLSDESGEHTLARLALWRDQVVACFTQAADPVHPALLALKRSAIELELPSQPFLDLIAANVQDQTVTRYETWDDLRQYCMLSAAPVGRMVLRAFGVREPRAEQLSDDVCIGLQLANFAQDVSVDRTKGRTYLLQADLRARGLEGAVQGLCERAESLLSSGRALEQMVQGRLRAQLALYRLGGMAILREIARAGYRTDRERPSVPRWSKAQLLVRAVKSSVAARGG